MGHELAVTCGRIQVVARPRADQLNPVMVELFEQRADPPTLAMDSRQVVSDERHDIRVRQPLFQFQPSRTVCHEATGLVPFCVRIHFRIPALFSHARFSKPELALWTGLIFSVFGERLADINEGNVALDWRTVFLAEHSRPLFV